MKIWYLKSETFYGGEREKDYFEPLILYIRCSLISIFFSMALPRVSKWPDIARTTRPERVRRSNSQMQYDPYLFLPFCTANGKFNRGHRPIITHNPLRGQLKIHVWLKGRTRILYQLLDLLVISLCMCTDIYFCGGGKLGQWNWMKKIKLTGNKSDSQKKKKKNLPEEPNPQVQRLSSCFSVSATAGYPPIGSTESFEEA